MKKTFDKKKLSEAFQVATANGYTEIVRLLLEAGANIHIGDDFAIRAASAFGHTEVVQLLLRAGANIHARDDAAIREAVEFNHTKIVKILLEAGANIHARDNAVLKLVSINGNQETAAVFKKYMAGQNNKSSPNLFTSLG